MTRHTSIALVDHLSAFVETQLQEGRYRSTDEVVAAALRLLEEEQKLERLKAAILEGEESGFPEDAFDFDEFIAEMKTSG